MGKMNYIYQSVLESAGDNPNEATQAAIDEITETKEKWNWNCREVRCCLILLMALKLK